MPGLFPVVCDFRTTDGAPFHPARFSDCRISQRIKIDSSNKSLKKSVFTYQETDSGSCGCPARVTCHISLYKEHMSGHGKHRRNTHCMVQRVDAAESVPDDHYCIQQCTSSALCRGGLIIDRGRSHNKLKNNSFTVWRVNAGPWASRQGASVTESSEPTS